MSRRSCEGLAARGATLSRAVRVMPALALTAVLAFAGAGGVGAQATPEAGTMASPAAGPCEPAAGTAAMAATPMASPVGEEEAGPVGTPVDDQALADEVTAAVENFVNCWNAGDLAAAFGLATPNLLQAQLGVADAAAAEEAVGAAPGDDLPLFTILETGEVQTYDDGRVSIHVVYMLGDHQYSDSRWYFVQADGQLLLDEVEQLRPQPEGDSAVISFSIADDTAPLAFDGATAVAATDVVILVGVNNGAERHIVQVVRLPEGMAGTPVPGAMPTEGEFVGRLSLGPGERQELALVDLEVGTFVVFDIAVDGSAATWEVTEPAA